MTLRSVFLLLACLLMLACSGPSKRLEEVLPAEAGAWTRSQVTPLPAAEAPEIVRQLGLKNAVSAVYTGPASVTVRVFEMNVATSAFELIQKWRQQDGLATYAGPYFIVADPSAGPQASGLLSDLQKQLQ